MKYLKEFAGFDDWDYEEESDNIDIQYHIDNNIPIKVYKEDFRDFVEYINKTLKKDISDFREYFKSNNYIYIWVNRIYISQMGKREVEYYLSRNIIKFNMDKVINYKKL